MGKNILLSVFLLSISLLNLKSQDFYFGADQSYVNQMEDCGVIYKENGEEKDVYQIYKDHGSNLVRLRLWHTPSWQDKLNDGSRYSDLDDVKKAIARAQNAGMDVLLDFHLSDTWADPGNQVAPAAWLPIVDDLDILKDSLYNYLFNTLYELNNEGLLPKIVQIGNETNKGILQSPEDNEEWKLDWPRNAALFNHGIKAVRDISTDLGKEVKIMIHVADPDAVNWLAPQFIQNGVTDFDILGISYYWAWHKPTSMQETAEYVQKVIEEYNKEVIIVETGYIWTTDFNDNANNIISEVHPDYSPASPENQRDWLIDMTQAVINAGAKGVVYWEPSWVSSPCSTPWGQGSHQEHATFFDFNNNLLQPGGIDFMTYDYGLSNTNDLKKNEYSFEVSLVDGQFLLIRIDDFPLSEGLQFEIFSNSGQRVSSIKLTATEQLLDVSNLSPGVYNCKLSNRDHGYVKRVFIP